MTSCMSRVQALNPFYMFQLFSCALWYGDEYYYYASCIIVVSCVSLAVQIYQTRSVCLSILILYSSLRSLLVCVSSFQATLSSDVSRPSVLNLHFYISYNLAHLTPVSSVRFYCFIICF